MIQDPFGDHVKRPLKIVVAGAQGSGKSENLKTILGYAEKQSMKGLFRVIDYSLGNELMEFLLLEINPQHSSAMHVVIFTMSPALHREMSRDLIASGIDGIVLIVDSGVARFQTNMRAIREMSESLSITGAEEESAVPVIIQFNKRDIKDKLPIPYLRSQLNLEDYPWVASAAGKGKGVLRTFRKALTAAIESRNSKFRSQSGLY